MAVEFLQSDDTLELVEEPRPGSTTQEILLPPSLRSLRARRGRPLLFGLTIFGAAAGLSVCGWMLSRAYAASRVGEHAVELAAPAVEAALSWHSTLRTVSATPAAPPVAVISPAPETTPEQPLPSAKPAAPPLVKVAPKPPALSSAASKEPPRARPPVPEPAPLSEECKADAEICAFLEGRKPTAPPAPALSQAEIDAALQALPLSGCRATGHGAVTISGRFTAAGRVVEASGEGPLGICVALTLKSSAKLPPISSPEQRFTVTLTVK
jgi:hypothetical protein